MVSAKVLAVMWMVFLVGQVQANGNKCRDEIKTFAEDVDQKMAQTQQQIQTMVPVLKDLMWHSFELEHQLRYMRERLAHFEKVVEPSRPVSEAASVPSPKAIDLNAGNIFIRPGQTTVGVIGGKLSSLLTENHNNDLTLGVSR